MNCFPLLELILPVQVSTAYAQVRVCTSHKNVMLILHDSFVPVADFKQVDVCGCCPFRVHQTIQGQQTAACRK